MKAALLLALGAAVRAHRIARELSQEKLADLSGIHRTYLSSLERGKRNATILVLARIARALNVPLTGLVPPLNHTIQKAKRTH